MHGTRLPADLQESERLPEPVFTPSTKAERGHDENISFSAAAGLLGEALAAKVRTVSLELYRQGADWGVSGASSSPTPSSRWASSRATSCCATRC